LGRIFLDPLRLELRRLFIRRFLSADAHLLNSVGYNPRGLIDCDRYLSEYFHWLARASRGGAAAGPNEKRIALATSCCGSNSGNDALAQQEQV
jgi:hypothetical protein